jgi:hypothetical protein
MSFRIILPLVVLSASIAFADSKAFDEELAEIDKEAQKLTETEQNLAAQIARQEELTKVKEERIILLRERLAELATTLPLPDPLNEAAAVDIVTEMSSEERESQGKKLISECNDRIVVLHAANGKSCTAFLAPHDGKARIFASAPWIAANARFTISDLHDNAVSFSQEIDCPAGVGLIGLKPEKSDLPVFAMAEETEAPAVGAGILVVVAEGESKGLQGIGGSIRGIGPDTLEIDAELTPEMSGAPVLSLINGKLIGIVAEQITGVEEDWATGTRHEGSRNFVVRLERSRDWRESDLGRFAKEAAYIAKIREKSRIAWISHYIMDGAIWKRTSNPYSSGYRRSDEENAWNKERRRMVELGGEALKKADEYPNNPYITRAKSWINQLGDTKYLRPDSDRDSNLVSIYRLILSELTKKEADLSAHLSPYHKEDYRLAMDDRAEVIRILTDRVNRVSR